MSIKAKESALVFAIKLTAIVDRSNGEDPTYKYQAMVNEITIDEEVAFRANKQDQKAAPLGDGDKKENPNARHETVILLNEILRSFHTHGTIPAHYNMELAYVVFEKGAVKTDLLVAYDVSRFKDTKVLSARYIRDENPESKENSTTGIITDLDGILESLDESDRGRIIWYKDSGFIRQEVRITEWKMSEHRGIEKVSFDQFIRVFRYPLGEACMALPLPGFEDPHNKLPEHVFVVGECQYEGQERIWGINKNIWANLENLTRFLKDEPLTKIDLLGATGKHAFAEAIHHGFFRHQSTYLTADASAHAEWETLEALLFAYIDAQGSKGSMVAAASKGTIFIDNTDWIPEQTRNFFMAAIHSGRYLAKRDQAFHEVLFPDVAWILGHSQHQKDSKAKPGQLELESPFGANPNYLYALVLYWIFRDSTSTFSSSLRELFEETSHPDVRTAQALWLNPKNRVCFRKKEADELYKRVGASQADAPCYSFADAKNEAMAIWFEMTTEADRKDAPSKPQD